jgi:hypothetical protein
LLGVGGRAAPGLGGVLGADEIGESNLDDAFAIFVFAFPVLLFFLV